jgi:hypothetical protein
VDFFFFFLLHFFPKFTNNLLMLQSDLHSLLCGYTGKTKSPYINTGEFLAFIKKFAAQMPTEQAEWAQWAFNAEACFKEKIPALLESGQCILSADGKEGKFFFPAYCRQLIDNAYKDAEQLVPFPNEESLRLKLPRSFVRAVNIFSDMELFFVRSENSPEPGDIVSLNFPQNFGNALLLAEMIPRKLMEISLLKVHHYLHSRNNGEYLLNKLIGRMQGKEKPVRVMIEQIMTRPLDSLSEMERSADFPYLFWTYFCPLAKDDIKKKNELFAEDMAALQAICIIEICCSFYRTEAAKKREKDAAFLTLEVLMDRSPWHYTLEEITAFTNDRGILLLDIYSQDDLENYILKSINEGGSVLPPWLVIHGEEGKRWFVKKGSYLSLCAKMFAETRQAVKAAIAKRWHELILNYEKEPSMKSDAEFEKLLHQQAHKIKPILHAILGDAKLQLVYEELIRVQPTVPLPARIFVNGELLPYSVLLSLRRKELLSEIRLQLPFWYSIPFVAAAIAFFKRRVLRRTLGKKKKVSPPEENEGNSDLAATEQKAGELIQSARLIESAIVPNGKTIDEYLAELEGKWLQLLNKKARQNLVIDVQSLLRDNLRNALKVYKLKRITRESLREMSALLIARSPGLQRIRDQESLCLYMELFTLQLLLQR